ncbi:MAG TPA: SRPBCC family protein [Acidimicrobiia bacterium]|nr:SRPBCC family protein [Acidimicrobiia bacterium]
MNIEDQFRVEVPVEEAWRLLLDIERIAPCLPGAQLQEVEGDEYRGVVKVKVGPITAQYQGSATLESTDDATHTAVIAASGRDTRGQGNASATVQLTLASDGSGTQVNVSTDLSITGKVAQFGRGVLVDVSAKLLAQFVENLDRDVLSVTTADPAPEDGPGAGAEPASPPPRSVDASANGGRPGVSSAAPAVVRTIDGPEAEPVDLLAVSGGSVGRRLLPVAVGILVVLLVVWGIRRRRRRRS